VRLYICPLKNLAGRIGALLEIPLPMASPYGVDRRGVLSPGLGSLASLAVQGAKRRSA
jgi:hypothetical protein